MNCLRLDAEACQPEFDSWQPLKARPGRAQLYKLSSDYHARTHTHTISSELMGSLLYLQVLSLGGLYPCRSSLRVVAQTVLSPLAFETVHASQRFPKDPMLVLIARLGHVTILSTRIGDGMVELRKSGITGYV